MYTYKLGRYIKFASHPFCLIAIYSSEDNEPYYRSNDVSIRWYKTKEEAQHDLELLLDVGKTKCWDKMPAKLVKEVVIELEAYAIT